MGDCIYMHLDEAGNFDFSENGSKYFVMTCVITREPFNHVKPLYDLKCECLSDGLDPKKCKDAHRFHATEDKQAVRDAVFNVIQDNLDNFSIYSVIIQKNKANPAIRDFGSLYQKVFSWLIGFIFSHEFIFEGDKIVIVTDSLPVQKKQDAIKGSLKKFLKKRAAEMGIEYRLYHHRSDSDINLQVADYCCWAIQRKWERGDLRSYDYIKSSICSEGNLLQGRRIEYYAYRN